jgi:hypothetical protein
MRRPIRVLAPVGRSTTSRRSNRLAGRQSLSQRMLELVRTSGLGICDYVGSAAIELPARAEQLSSDPCSDRPSQGHEKPPEKPNQDDVNGNCWNDQFCLLGNLALRSARRYQKIAGLSFETPALIGSDVELSIALVAILECAAHPTPRRVHSIRRVHIPV